VPASRFRTHRVVALFGTGALVIGRFWFEAIVDRAISSRWPLVPLLLAGLIGVGAAVFAVFVSVSPLARKEKVPAMRWGAAAVMLFMIAFLAGHTAGAPNAFVVGACLLAGCLCAWRGERLERAATSIARTDV